MTSRAFGESEKPGIYDQPDKPDSGPLYGLRVVDLTGARAGPTCVRQLADMGADVIQVRAPGRADLGGSDLLNLHRNKRSIVINLKSEQGRAALLRLIERADVLVENFRPDVKHRLGIAPEAMLALNPRLIYASISGFGQDGPYLERPGMDQIAQGYGLMNVTGQPDGLPTRMGVAVTDTVSGMLLTQGVLAALVARHRTGRGQWVHTSLVETAISLLDFQAARWLIDKEVPGRTGNHHPTVVPMGTFRTADGYLNLAPITAAFKEFACLLGAPELADDARFIDGDSRAANRRALEAAIEAVTVTRTSDEWMAVFVGKVPCGKVLAVDEVFADPQVRHLRVTRATEAPDGSEIEVLRLPVNFSDTPPSIRMGMAAPGAHTRAVLEELGYGEDEILAMLDSGAVATAGDGAEWGYK
jgi:crotonobetainyl-CoA:carnitine CoA-transferase CaiB-like acyl-CoA transferase